MAGAQADDPEQRPDHLRMELALIRVEPVREVLVDRLRLVAALDVVVVGELRLLVGKLQ